MATTGTPKVNKPTNLKEKEADVNRKLQLYGIVNAFQNGKVPSNDQIDVALSSFLESKALRSPSQKLSSEGQTLVGDVREVITQAKRLLLSKNEGNLLQDFIWQTQQFDPKSVAVPGAPVDKSTAQQHGNEALEYSELSELSSSPTASSASSSKMPRSFFVTWLAMLRPTLLLVSSLPMRISTSWTLLPLTTPGTRLPTSPRTR